jgi:general secretion pathway protein H
MGCRISGPRADPGRTARASAAGFTLIEIMVVVVIIALISTGVILSVNLTGRDNELEKESNRLLALVNYTREQAELQTREYGILFQEDSYEFVSYDPRRALWRGVFEDDALRQRKLPDGLDIKLIVEGRPVVLQRPKDSKDKTPQVMLFSTGDISSFEVTIERDAGVHSVSLAPNDKGDVEAKPMVINKS